MIALDDAGHAAGEPVALDGFDFNHSYVGNDGSRFFVLTDFEAPNKRIVAIDLAMPSAREDVVAESASPIEDASHVGGHFVVQRLRDVASEVTIYSEAFELVRTVELPALGVGGLAASPTSRRFLQLYQLQSAGDALSLRHRDGQKRDLQGAGVDLRSGGLRCRAGVLREHR